MVTMSHSDHKYPIGKHLVEPTVSQLYLAAIKFGVVTKVDLFGEL